MPYADGDDLHPPANIAKMSRGEPLGDDDRRPWLLAVADRLRRDAPLVVGCSALKRRYRDWIRDGAGGPVTFVHLAGSRTLIAERMKARTGHFMPPSLLDSQFAALEPPDADERAVALDIDAPIGVLTERIVVGLRELPK